ncbi:MAG TPA: response regulator [Methanoregula sp.]|nr:response regulator [Methanoregula sp.]
MGKNVLVVEDDAIIQQVLEWRLNTLGYTVCGKAATSDEAITCVREKKPDAVLMDIDLGGLVDGIDTAVAIKKMHKVPVIFLTASSTQADIDRAKMVPADGFILKPFNDTDIRVALTLAIPDTGPKLPE